MDEGRSGVGGAVHFNSVKVQVRVQAQAEVHALVQVWVGVCVGDER